MITGKNGIRSRNLLYLVTRLCLLMLPLVILYGCKVYSFTGASIPPEAKTISIQYIENKADVIEPTLSAALTESLRDRFIAQTSLVLVNADGDLQIEGEIRRYDVDPVAIQGDETAALNRLTIAVVIQYTNTIDDTKDYETTFARYEDYPSDQDITQAKDVLIPIINAQLVDDIFNKAVVNW